MCFLLFIAYGVSTQVLILPVLGDSAVLADDVFSGLGVNGLLPAALYAFVQTGLTEEIVFRGFIGKRLIARFGFAVGNTASLTGCTCRQSTMKRYRREDVYGDYFET